MKNSPATQINFVNKMFGIAATTTQSRKPSDVKVTLRVEDGIVHINNVSGKPEGVMYTLMTENQDGSTKLTTRYVALAPFQAYADDIDAHVVAAWEKN